MTRPVAPTRRQPTTPNGRFGRRRLLGAGLGALALAGCALPTAADGGRTSVVIFAASSLTESFQAVATSMASTRPDFVVQCYFAGSPALRHQLAQGARADLLATADEQTMAGARADGSLADEPRVFARNRLVVATPVGGRVQRLADLANAGTKLVLAMPETPAGAYARQGLANLSRNHLYGPDFADRVLGNVVSQESNVRQVLAKVQLGEADAGIVYATDLAVAGAAVTGIAFPDGAVADIRYPIALVNGAANPEAARAVVAWLRGGDGQRLLTSFGFLPAGGRDAGA